MRLEKDFKKAIYGYYRKNGRHELPWRKTRDPYRILVSEIMLQQTQVGRVGQYYKIFLKRFPNFQALAAAPTDDVLRIWQGLGYNRRALALQKLSRIVLEKYNGRLPQDREALEALPGIGRYTAGALLVFAFNRPEVMVETNIRRVFIHFFFPRKKIVTDAELGRYIEGTIDKKNPRKWYYALMDHGAMLGAQGKTLALAVNPNRRSAHYKKQSRFEGSDRELRGKMLKMLLKEKNITASSFVSMLKESKGRVDKIILSLEREGFVEKEGNYFTLARTIK